MGLGMVMTQHVQRAMHDQPNEFLPKRDTLCDRRPAGGGGAHVHVPHERPIVPHAKRDHVGGPIPLKRPPIQRAHALAREKIHVHGCRSLVFLLEHRPNGPADERRAQPGCHPGRDDDDIMRGQPASTLRRSHLPSPDSRSGCGAPRTRHG